MLEQPCTETLVGTLFRDFTIGLVKVVGFMQKSYQQAVQSSQISCVAGACNFASKQTAVAIICVDYSLIE